MTTSLTFSQFHKHSVQLVEQALAEVVPANWPVESILRDSMDYSLFAGGKRIRPALVFAALESLGKPIQLGVPAACSLEMIHTYSLIHDDLPAMDNDDLRRGKPTNHKVFGEAMAILAGDALLTHAFFVLTTMRESSAVANDAIVQVIAELSAFAGLRGMVSGQAADIIGEQGITSLAQLQAIHRDKTGALIVCALRIGGLIGAANSQQLLALEQFGRCVGQAFQIQDDILDVIGDPEKLGKPLRSDEKSEKVTYPYFLGLEGSRAEVRKLTDEARKIVANGGFVEPLRLLEIADYLLNRDY